MPTTPWWCSCPTTACRSRSPRRRCTGAAPGPRRCCGIRACRRRRTTTEMVSSVDLMPTLLELLDVPPPPGMDGRSWGPLLRGEAQPMRDAVVTHVNTVSSGARFPQRCVRTRTRSLLWQPWADGRTHGSTSKPCTERRLPRHAPRRPSRWSDRPRVRQLVAGVPLALYDLRARSRRAPQRDRPAGLPRRRRATRIRAARAHGTHRRSGAGRTSARPSPPCGRRTIER